MVKNESEGFKAHQQRKKLGSRGKAAESVVEAELRRHKEKYSWFDYDRLPDSRSAGRIMPARVSDFTLFINGTAVSLEVKEKKKGSRLTKKDFPQLPRMVRRAQAGCPGAVLVHFLELESWAVVDVHHFWEKKNQPSWDLRPRAIHPNCQEAFEKLIIAISEQYGRLRYV